MAEAAGQLMDAEARNGADLLDEIEAWFTRFIAVTDDGDLQLLTLWTVSTHLAIELYTTPRLLIDSTMHGSGKTTVLDHVSRLGWKPVHAATLSSPALLVRLLQHGVRTILIDEVDRSLHPNKPGVDDLIGILNSGYRRGATRPVLVPDKGGHWKVEEMPTFAPVAMAGNSPRLPDDTRSRSIRILLTPDLDGIVEDSDWERLEDEAKALHDALTEFADSVRELVVGMDVSLPAGCIGRAKEKWRPLKRVAAAAGGRWPLIADELIGRGMAEDADEREAGLKKLPAAMVLLKDLHSIWPDRAEFVPTQELVSRLINHNPEFWGAGSDYGKPLTETRFGKMVNQASKLTSQRPGGRGPRGFHRSHLKLVWHRLGIGRKTPGAPGEPGAPGVEIALTSTNHVNQVENDAVGPTHQLGKPGDQHKHAEMRQVHRDNQVHRVETEALALGELAQQVAQSRRLCGCGRPGRVRTDTGMCDWCTVKAANEVPA